MSGVWGLGSFVWREGLLFLLVFLRVIGFLFASPILGSRNIPPQVKAGLGLLLALLLYPPLRQASSPLPEDPVALALEAIQEIVLGIILGSVVRVFFTGALMAGELIGLQMGFNLAALLDPQFAHPTPVVSQFLDRLMVLVFFTADGHHLLIQALGRSFQWVPLFRLGAGDWGPGTEVLIRLFGPALILAVKLSAPLLAATFIAHMALALMAKAAPQMNVMIIGAPLTLYLGLLVFLTSLPFMVRLFEAASGRLETDLLLVLRSMSHALP